MVDPELRRAALVEMASIRSQLSDLEVYRNRPFGRYNSLRQYVFRLEALLAQLEHELHEHEQGVLERFSIRRCRSRSS